MSTKARQQLNRLIETIQQAEIRELERLSFLQRKIVSRFLGWGFKRHICRSITENTDRISGFCFYGV